MILTGTSYATRELNQHIPVYCGTVLNLDLVRDLSSLFIASTGKFVVHCFSKISCNVYAIYACDMLSDLM